MKKGKEMMKEKVLKFLKEHGVTVSSVFGNGSDKLDPIDRYVVLRDLFEDILGYRMEKDGLTYIDPETNSGIVHSNMKDFDAVTSLDECVTLMKYVSYQREAWLLQARESFKREQAQTIDEEQLERYFQKEHDTSLKDLFSNNSYYRYTKEGSEMLLSGIEFYTGWQMGKHGLQIQDPNDEKAFIAHPKVKSINDFKSIQDYLSKINELRKERDVHLHLLKEGRHAFHEQEQKDTLKKEVAEYLKGSDWNVDMLFDQKRSARQRKEKMNAVLQELAQSYVNEENNVMIINPIGEAKQITRSGEYNLSTIEDVDHFIHLVQGLKENRDLSFFIASPFVRENREITEQAIRQAVETHLDISFDALLEGKGMTKKERTKHLDALHFYLTEAHQDHDMDIVVSHPDNEKKFVSFKHIENKEQYYDSITSLEDFMERVQHARSARNMLHQKMERLKQLPEKDQEKVLGVWKNGDDELER